MSEDGDAGAGDDDLDADGKKPAGKRNYRPAWQLEFGRWLTGMAKDSKPDSPVMAFCQACGMSMDNKKHSHDQEAQRRLFPCREAEALAV
jgi:hypothetical protein